MKKLTRIVCEKQDFLIPKGAPKGPRKRSKVLKKCLKMELESNMGPLGGHMSEKLSFRSPKCVEIDEKTMQKYKHMYKKTVPCACTGEGKDRDLTNKNEEKNNELRPRIAIKHRKQKEKDVRRHQTNKPLGKQTQKADVEAGKQQASTQAAKHPSK